MTIASVVPQICVYMSFSIMGNGQIHSYSVIMILLRRGGGGESEFFLGKEGLVNRLLILINS